MKAARNTIIVLFTRDPRIHRHPALAAAVRAGEHALGAWKAGRTGHPLVDGAMRQLATEGRLPKRARLVTAAFLWVAGIGNDTPQHRRFNPLRQERRFDPEGVHVRRWVPELVRVHREWIHTPWRIDARARARLDYPAPVVEPTRFDAARRVRGAA